MIARVKRVWEGDKRVEVILVEDGQIKQTHTFLWLPEQQLQAALCAQVEKQFGKAGCPRFVVQLAPPERWGASHIEVLEMIHEPKDDAVLDAAISAIERDIRTELDTGESDADVFERLHGHQGQKARRVYD